MTGFGLSRRGSLQLMLASAAMLCASSARATGLDSPAIAGSGTARPRRLVQILLKGGSDVLYSMNPKEAREVESGIGPTYGPNELLWDGTRRFAPAWGPLRKYFHRMRVINGINVGTVAHAVGLAQVEHLRQDFLTPRSETALGQLGALLEPTSPIHSLHLDLRAKQASPEHAHILTDAPGGTLLAELHRIANNDALADMALDGLTRQNAGVTAKASARALEHLLVRMQRTPLPKAEVLKSDTERWPSWFLSEQAARYEALWAMQFEWALFALQHELAPTVYLTLYPQWDSHNENSSIQQAHQEHFALRFAHFLDRLRSNHDSAGVSLLDQTGILLMSGELGRFPYLNSQRGKDHFPEISVMLMGPGIAPGTTGESDRELASRSLSPANGRVFGGRAIDINDVGRTLFEWLGTGAAERENNRGRCLEFCFR
jgi:Protein of unknown function (DUF1501)